MAAAILETSMSYIEQNLSSGETVLYQTRLHWVVMIAPCIAALVAGLWVSDY